MNQYEVESSLAETESALVNAASSLVDHERRERFIGERICYFRAFLMQRRKDGIQNLQTNSSSSILLLGKERGYIEEEEEEDEEEGWNSGDLECSTTLSPNSRTTHHDEGLSALQMKHIVSDEINLQSVVELHKSIIAEIETLRRRVEDLTEKRDDIVKKMEECRDLIVDSTVDW